MSQRNMVVAGQWGQTSKLTLVKEDLDTLEAAVREYRRGGNHGLNIIGQGSISIVIEWQSGSVVVKPLPLFPSRTAFETYAFVLGRHFQILDDAQVSVLSTTLQGLESEDGGWLGWLIQPKVASEKLLPQYLRNISHREAVAKLSNLAAHITAAVSPRFGLDADITNWCVDETGRLLLLDSSTPLVRDERGHELLDMNIFLASIPRVLRAPINRFVVPRLINKFFESRSLFVDILSGFYSEQLSQLLPEVISQWNSLIENEMTEAEILKYKRRNEQLWRTLSMLARVK